MYPLSSSGSSPDSQDYWLPRLAKGNAWVVAIEVEQLTSLNPATKLWLAQESARLDVEGVIECFEKFKFTDQESRSLVAISCAKNNPWFTASHLSVFQDITPGAIEIIAKSCVSGGGKDSCSERVDRIAQRVKFLRFSTDSSKESSRLSRLRTEIVNRCACIDGASTASHIEDFGITDPATLIEIAKLCVQHGGGSVAANIERFRIKDQTALIEIAKLCAQQDGDVLARNIDKFKITDPLALIEIARLCAKKGGGDVFECFEKFSINHEPTRIAIAKLCVMENSWKLMENLERFRIEDEAALIEIAKLCAETQGYVAETIEKFRIKDQTALIEIAKLCAKKTGANLCRNIGRFGIKDEATLIEIAELCIQNNAGKVAENIEKFQIEDEAALRKIAKLCAQNERCFFEHIKKFRINDLGILIEIAELCAERDPENLARAIGMFQIKDEAVLFRLAMISAKNVRFLEVFAKNLCNFRISREGDRVLIAQVCAETHSKEIANYIRCFCITDRLALTQIASICIDGDNLLSVDDLQKFSQGNEHLIDLLSLYMKKSQIEASKVLTALIHVIPLLEARDTKHKLLARKIGLFAAVKAVQEGDEIAISSWIREPDFQEIIKKISSSLFPRAHKLLLEVCNCPVPPPGEDLDRSVARIQERIKQILEGPTSHEKTVQLTQLLLLALAMEGEVQESDFVDSIKALITYRSPNIAALLAWGSAEMTEEQKTYYLSLRERGLLVTNTRLPLIPLCRWILPGGDLSFAEKVAEGVHARNRDFKNLDSGLLSAWLNTCTALDSTKLPSKRKLELISHALLPKTMELKILLSRLALIQSICLIKQETILLEPPLEDTMWDQLNQRLLQSITESCGLLLEGIPDVMQRFTDTWGKIRVDQGWLIYGKGLQSLSDPLVNREYNEMIRSVLLGTFLQERYRCDKSPHLAKLQAEHPDFFTQWQRGSETTLVVNEKPYLVLNTDNWEDLFLSATEASPTCESIFDSPMYNRCLLAHVMDGKNRMLAIKDPHTGKLIARCMIRILFQEGRPVLFREDIYHKAGTPIECLQSLEKLSRQLAHSLGCSLYTFDKGEKELADPVRELINLDSLGSRAPWEDVNHFIGKVKGGVFRVVCGSNCYKINTDRREESV